MSVSVQLYLSWSYYHHLYKFSLEDSYDCEILFNHPQLFHQSYFAYVVLNLILVIKLLYNLKLENFHLHFHIKSNQK